MPINIGIIGASGKMGKRLIALGACDPDLRIAGGICSPDSPNLTLDLGLLAGVSPLGIACSEKIDTLSCANVAIDFSHSALLPAIIEFAKKHKKPLVIGTTGYREEQQLLLQEASKQIPIFYAPNFSLGIALLLDAARRISSSIPLDFSISIEETHHVHKKDAPSGTALALEAILPKDRQIPIVCKREGDVIGEHSVTFESEQERVVLSHSALTRDLFARGALLAAKFIIHQPAGLFGMAHLIST